MITEGSSDAKIIQNALQLFRPHIADFFRFVDMEDGYPFSGIGNLHKFTQGLPSVSMMVGHFPCVKLESRVRRRTRHDDCQ